MRILLLTFITFSLALHGMKMNETELNEFTTYQNHCITIKTFLDHEKNDFFEMIYNKNLDPTQELMRINQQFSYYKDKLNNERSASLLQLKNLHNINDKVWSEGMQNLENIKATVKNHINTMLPDAMHDPIISGENKILFTKYLKKYGLDIKKIGIKKKDAPDDELKSFLGIINNEHDTTITVRKKPKIVISSPLFKEMSPTQQKAILLRFAWIMGNICTINTAFLSFIINNTNKDYDFNTLQNSEHYCFFATLERQKLADIFPCLDDYQAGEFMENLRYSICSFPLNLEEQKENFQQICILKNLWEKRKILEELIQK
jgi:hypothetical protein